MFSQTRQLVRRIHPLKQLRVVPIGSLEHLQVESIVTLSDYSKCYFARIAESFINFDFVVEHLAVHQNKVFYKVFVFGKTDKPTVVRVKHLERDLVFLAFCAVVDFVLIDEPVLKTESIFMGRDYSKHAFPDIGFSN